MMVTKPRQPEEDVGLRLLARMIARAHLKRIAESASSQGVGVGTGIDSLRREGQVRQESARDVQRRKAKARTKLT